MKRCAALMLVLVLTTLAPVSSKADFKKTKIAVLDFTLQGEGYETKDMGAIVAEWFITAFVKAGRFDVVERGMISKIIEEQKLSMSGILDDNTATKIGKLLGVETIISGSVLKLQNIMEINARIIDVETGSIKAAENVKSSAAIRLQDLVVQMSEKIIKNFPLQGYVVYKTENTVSIDLGRTAGAREGMEFIVYKEGEVIRHPKTGEVLDVEQIQTGRLVLRKIRDKLSEGEIVEEDPPGAIEYGQLVYSAGAMAVEKPEPQPAPEGPPPPSGMGRLYVDTTPDSALVRILNIGPRYYDGIELRPGSYHIEVSAPGHRTDLQWVTVDAGEDKRISVDLGGGGGPSADLGGGGGSTADLEGSGGSTDEAALSSAAGSEAQAELPPGVSSYVRMLRSGSSRQIVSASKAVVRMRSIHAAILEAANDVLLSGYRSNSGDRQYVDAMSWLCNLLGASGSGQYRATLQTVAGSAPNSKLKKYALKNLKKLK